MSILANAGIELPTAPEYDRFNPGKSDEYESMDRDVENAVAQAQAQVAGQISAAAQQQAQAAAAQQQAQDPRFQLAQQDLQLRAQDLQRKAQEGAVRNEIKQRDILLKEEAAAEHREEVAEKRAEEKAAAKKKAEEQAARTYEACGARACGAHGGRRGSEGLSGLRVAACESTDAGGTAGRVRGGLERGVGVWAAVA